MEINDLRIFQAVGYEKSISKAALNLGYAQSNITMRIKILENELNTTLFIRNSKGVTITSHGKKLLEYADKIIKLADEATAEFVAPNINSKLKIGANQTISASKLPKLLTLFHEKNPLISLVLKTNKQQALLDDLFNNEIDGAFIHDQGILTKVKEIFSYTEEIALISPINISATNSINIPIIVASDNNCPYRRILENWFTINNSNPSAIIEFDTLESILKGISEGLGVSLLPKSILPINHNYHLYNLGDNFNELKIKFVINRNIKANDSLKSFINIAKESANNSIQ